MSVFSVLNILFLTISLLFFFYSIYYSFSIFIKSLQYKRENEEINEKHKLSYFFTLFTGILVVLFAIPAKDDIKKLLQIPENKLLTINSKAVCNIFGKKGNECTVSCPVSVEDDYVVCHLKNKTVKINKNVIEAITDNRKTQ